MYAPETYKNESLPQPGWFEDPAGTAMLRWWAGNAWTNELRPRPNAASMQTAVTSTYVPMADYYRPAVREHAIAVGSPQTTAIWMLALYPVIALALQLIVAVNPNRPDIQVAVLVVQVGAIFALAAWDHLALRDRNIDAPSLWWLLLAYPLSYLVARWIKLGSRGLSAAGPPLVFIASTIAAVVFVISPLLLTK